MLFDLNTISLSKFSWWFWGDTSYRWIMLEKQLICMKLVMSLKAVLMLFLIIQVIHGSGIVYVLVVELMEDFVVLTPIQVRFCVHLIWRCTSRSKVSLANILDFGSSGVFSFLSYRDPNLLKTLDVYDGTSSFLKELEMDNDALTKAIIGTIGDVDSYQLPDAKGYSR